MRSRRLALSLLALATLIAVPATAHAADEAGGEGRAISVEVNAQSSDAYLIYHGRIFVRSNKTSTEYRWGGTSCGSRTMTPDMVALLVETVRESDDALITPKYQDGQGSAKCLVGFSIKHKEKKGD